MRYGQNFLIDENIAERQVSYANVQKKDVVLEIGPGYGILTKKIAEKAGKVIAIEIDERFSPFLSKIHGVKMIWKDVLDVDLEKLGFNKVIANISYQISSPFTFKLLKICFEVGVIMYQREFAERLIAKPGEKSYSRLSIMASFNADWEILEIVPPSAFSPKPKISSCIVQVVPTKPKFLVKSEKIFSHVVKALFSQRRKKIKNVLINNGMVQRENIEKIPYKEKRVECLSPQQIAEISDAVLEVRNEGKG